MHQYSFDNVFEKLHTITKEFEQGVSEDRKKQLLEDLLSLRNYMDKCVHYWLNFEEIINQLQQTHNFTLPDEVPQDFLNILEKEQSNHSVMQTINTEVRDDNTNNISLIENSIMTLEESQTITNFRRGLGFWELKMIEEAICEFEKVVKEEPDFIFGHFCLGLAYCQKKLYEKSLNHLRLVKSLCKDKDLKALASNAIGNIYAEKKDFLQALNEFTKTTEIDPSFNMAWFNIGATLYNLKRYQEATKAFEKAYQYYPYDLEICYYLGKVFGITGDYNKAIYYLSKAKDINPSSPVVLFELGFIHDILGNESLAREYYTIIKSQNNNVKR